MSLFDEISNTITIHPQLKERIVELCEFVKRLDKTELAVVDRIYKEVDVDEWIASAFRAQNFAYSHNLKENWWKVVKIVRRELRSEFWFSNLSPIFDSAECLLIQPWVGTAFSQKDFNLLTKPLRAVGFQF